MGEAQSGSTIVIPAEAGISGRIVSAGLPEIPAFAGMTGEVSAGLPEIPAFAGMTGEVSAGLPGIPAFAGTTHCRMGWDPGFRRGDAPGGAS